MYDKASQREVFPAPALDTMATFLTDATQVVSIFGPPCAVMMVYAILILTLL
jgi:hypothetical protein